MKRFAEKTRLYKLFTIFTKRSILDVWQGSEYATDYFFSLSFSTLFTGVFMILPNVYCGVFFTRKKVSS